MTETRQEKMNRLTRDAKLIKHLYNKEESDPKFLIGGKFTLTEMIKYREFYNEVNDLFIPLGKEEIIEDENFEVNMTEFLAVLIMSNEELYRFLANKCTETRRHN